MLTHPKRAMLLAAVVSVVSIALGARLTVDPNMLVLLPSDHPTSQAIQRINDEEGGTNLLTLGFAGADVAARDVALSSLARELEQVEGVEYALFDLEDELAWRLGMLQLSAEELRAIEVRLKGAVALGPAAANPFVAQRLLDLGPLTQRLAREGVSTSVLPSKDGLGRILVRPTGPAYDARFAAPFLERLEAAVEQFDAQNDDVELVWIGGAHRHAVEDIQTIRNDLAATAGVSAVLVLLLISLAFRDLRATLLVFLPLVFANIWTTGFASVALGTLNTFTSFYPAILVGLGVDFSLHLYARYREERPRYASTEDAIYAAWDSAGPPCLTAAVTSAGGFCALWVAGFGGFRQLGTLLGMGVLLCLGAVVWILPLLLRWRAEKDPTADGTESASEASEGSSGSGVRWAPIGLLVAGLVTLLSVTQLDRVTFEYDLSALRKVGLSYSDLSEDERAAASSSFAPVVASFATAADLAAAHTRLSARLDADDLPYVSSLLSVHSVLPVDQQARVDALASISALAKNPAMRFLPLAAQQNLAALAQHEPRMLTAEDLPHSLRHAIGAAQPRPRMLLIPGGNQWDLRNNSALKASVEEALPEAELAGEYLALAVLYELVIDDVPWVAGTAFAVVFLLSWLDLRKLGRAAWTVTALAAGMAWAGAGMVAFDIQLSVVNFVGIPILMGIGVDVIIHLMHRVEAEGPGGVRRALSTTGWASLLSATTTILSFLSLTIAEHQGVRSLGHLIVLGLSLVTLGGFAVVPLGWLTIWRMKRTPTAGDE